MPTLRRLTAEAAREGWLVPQAVYGIFPRAVAGQRSHRVRPRRLRERRRRTARDGALHFPRQVGRERLCIADYFRSRRIGRGGCRGVAGRHGRRRGHASDSRHCSAPASTRRRTTCTDWRSRQPRRSRSGCIAASDTNGDPGASQGKRYSWGYGACPDLDDHATVFRLLPARMPSA